jgi:hypothetical protein
VTEQERISALLQQPAITIPEAAGILRISRNSGYEAARKGELKTVNFGKRKLVPTAWLRRVLGMEAA